MSSVYFSQCDTNIYQNQQISSGTRLEQNIKFAEEAILHTVSALPRGASNKVDSKISYDEILEMRKEQSSRMQQCEMIANMGLLAGSITALMMKEIRGEGLPMMIWASCLCISLNTSILDEAKQGILSYVAKFYKVGNCGEHARVALDYLKENSFFSRAELVADVVNDHSFVVIDRDLNSALNDPTTWGSSSIVCDPWAKEYFPASQLMKKLPYILSTRSASPKKWQKEDFRVLPTHDNSLSSLFSYYAGKTLSAVTCLDMYLKQSINVYLEQGYFDFFSKYSSIRVLT